MSIPAVILGASGYVGGELLRLIAGHPEFELQAAVSDSAAGKPIGDLFGHLATALDGCEFAIVLTFQKLADIDAVSAACRAERKAQRGSGLPLSITRVDVDQPSFQSGHPAGASSRSIAPGTCRYTQPGTVKGG